MPIQIQVALIAAVVVMLGWVVTNNLAFRNLNRARRLEAKLQHVRQQIQELYGPMLGLLRERQLVYEIMTKRLPTRPDGKIDRDAFDADHSVIFNFLVEEYLMPINKQISTLLREKNHLLATLTLPETFQQFQNYRAYVETLHILWKRTGKESRMVTGRGWPDGIEVEVQGVLTTLRAEHDRLIEKGAITS